MDTDWSAEVRAAEAALNAAYAALTVAEDAVDEASSRLSRAYRGLRAQRGEPEVVLTSLLPAAVSLAAFLDQRHVIDNILRNAPFAVGGTVTYEVVKG